MLAAAGNRVLVPRLPPAAAVAQRAAELKAFLDREAAGERVHLIAHSMGGLDSRYLISRLGMAERVLSLTTLGTPHRGTAFADWGVRCVEPVVRPVLDVLGLPYQAFRDLTTVCCTTFNEQTPDAPNVRYFSVAGQFVLDWTQPHWQLPCRIIEGLEGPNDGLVSVASARWGEAFEVWDGDHASLVNRTLTVAPVRRRWPDRIPQYAALLERLAAV
jgi:triacylglycerol lipase